MLSRLSRNKGWSDWDDRTVQNGLVIIGFVLGFALVLIPALQMILEVPTYRLPALVLGIGLLAASIIVFTLPRQKYKYTPEPGKGERSTSIASEITLIANGSQEAMVGAILELRSIFMTRVRTIRRMSEKDLRMALGSPGDLHLILGDELLERLLMEDPRHLSADLNQEGDFMVLFEELLSRAEDWR